MNRDYLWIRFRKSVAEIEANSGYAVLSPLSRRVLEWVAFRAQSGPQIFVQTVIEHCAVGAMATLHKCLAELQEKEFLVFTVDTQDRRRKILTLSPKSRKLFDRLDSEAVNLTSRLR
jgi:DNA-binding MarR family transcriptional regulator